MNDTRQVLGAMAIGNDRDFDREVIALAIELHAQEEANSLALEESERMRTAMREAVVSLGIDDAIIARAETVLAERRANAAAERRWRRKALGRFAAALLGVATAAIAAWYYLVPAAPWTDRLDDRTRWTLAANPESQTAITWSADGAREVATAFVDVFAESPGDGSWRADLRGAALGPIEGHDKLVVELQGTLARTRVVLRSGPDERWVSPTIPLDSTWTRHTLALRSFEHQRLARGGWGKVRDRDKDEPHDVDLIVLTLGEPMNSLHASGAIRVRELRVE